MGRSLAEELGAVRLSRADIGLDVTGYIDSDNKSCVRCGRAGDCRMPEDQRKCIDKLPSGHRFFNDCQRESYARTIERIIKRDDIESWFVTLTFRNELSVEKAHRLLNSWLLSLGQALKQKTGAGGLNWIVAQEWQKRHVIHFHAIIYGVRLHSLNRKFNESRWLEMAGGFACIYDASPKAAPYLAVREHGI